jgi:hypothetical protein
VTLTQLKVMVTPQSGSVVKLESAPVVTGALGLAATSWKLHCWPALRPVTLALTATFAVPDIEVWLHGTE